MKQISNDELKYLKTLPLKEVMLYVCNINMTYYRWRHIDLKWVDEGNGHKFVILKTTINLFKLQIVGDNTYVHLLLPSVKEKNIPPKDDLNTLFSTFDIEENIVWVNDWLFGYQKKRRLFESIHFWVKAGDNIVIIKHRLLRQKFSEKEVENLLCSHPVFANTDIVIAMYPHRLAFLDKSKLKKFNPNEHIDWAIVQKIEDWQSAGEEGK